MVQIIIKELNIRIPKTKKDKLCVCVQCVQCVAIDRKCEKSKVTLNCSRHSHNQPSPFKNLCSRSQFYHSVISFSPSPSTHTQIHFKAGFSSSPSLFIFDKIIPCSVDLIYALVSHCTYVAMTNSAKKHTQYKCISIATYIVCMYGHALVRTFEHFKSMRLMVFRRRSIMN